MSLGSRRGGVETAGRQQSFDLGKRLRLGQLCEYVAQVGVGLEPIRFRALGERVDPDTRVGAGHGVAEQSVAPPVDDL